MYGRPYKVTAALDWMYAWQSIPDRPVVSFDARLQYERVIWTVPDHPTGWYIAKAHTVQLALSKGPPQHPAKRAWDACVTSDTEKKPFLCNMCMIFDCFTSCQSRGVCKYCSAMSHEADLQGCEPACAVIWSQKSLCMPQSGFKMTPVGSFWQVCSHRAAILHSRHYNDSDTLVHCHCRFKQPQAASNSKLSQFLTCSLLMFVLHSSLNQH